ncbi:MAG TPA: hypothetical protein PLD20_25790 [Blastocatellia bacterium]|nr:hypothetical protein [Blastocatellia bacterium]HMX28521.1 hypothetical protein [Blastocatellia bacterium]HMY76180.1 hypothetical protein [Blastocatellia bacterium]HMZ21371.1 hypothetical protein [Blastocatellia bacterium]HNG30843.1 hypothetical protein [Blastocatellia bacterium]
MANEALVQEIKKIVSLARSGNLDEAYSGYRNLFASPAFMTYRPEEQRQALRLMIYAKGVPSQPTPAMVEAHRAAVAPLTQLVEQYREPADHEMLGMCEVILGNEEAAGAIFRAGLAIERQINPQSDLCGALMKRISLL